MDSAESWKNSYRYAPSGTYKRDLLRRDETLVRGIKGDPVKENARRAVNAADAIVTLGLRIWT